MTVVMLRTALMETLGALGKDAAGAGAGFKDVLVAAKVRIALIPEALDPRPDRSSPFYEIRQKEAAAIASHHARRRD